ncbi:hypothetical protein BKA81DRAFT_124310 [Phyllosticta paracitricarpa]
MGSSWWGVTAVVGRKSGMFGLKLSRPACCDDGSPGPSFYAEKTGPPLVQPPRPHINLQSEELKEHRSRHHALSGSTRAMHQRVVQSLG